MIKPLPFLIRRTRATDVLRRPTAGIKDPPLAVLAATACSASTTKVGVSSTSFFLAGAFLAGFSAVSSFFALAVGFFTVSSLASAFLAVVFFSSGIII